MGEAQAGISDCRVPASRLTGIRPMRQNGPHWPLPDYERRATFPLMLVRFNCKSRSTCRSPQTPAPLGRAPPALPGRSLGVADSYSPVQRPICHCNAQTVAEGRPVVDASVSSCVRTQVATNCIAVTAAAGRPGARARRAPARPAPPPRAARTHADLGRSSVSGQCCKNAEPQSTHRGQSGGPGKKRRAPRQCSCSNACGAG